MQQVRFGHADALEVGEDGDEVPSPRLPAEPQPREKPKSVPLPWVTSPQELPFQTGERP